MSKKTDERFTPTRYLNSVRKVFDGEITLDAFSSPIGNTRVKANHFYTKEEDAFTQNLFGNVFANPPYSRGYLPKTAEYIHRQFVENRNFKQTIILVPNWTERKWFQELLSNHPCCFTDHRIDFLHYIERRKAFFYLGNPEHGSCFFYIGTNHAKFAMEFSQYGYITNLRIHSGLHLPIKFSKI